ncbi:MAG: NAD(P)-dependent oxidoreductase [Bacteroidota bacterium]
MQKRILLTGSNGLLGQKITNLLTGRVGIDLLAASRGVNRNPNREGYKYKDADLTDKQIWKDIFETFRPTEVIHTAAITQVDTCEDEQEMCELINHHAVAYLCELCVEYRARLIHISTDFVFDGEHGPYREEDSPNPVNFYGMSKWKAEQAIQASEVSAVILRTILLYGITHAMSRSNIVLWVKKSLEEGKSINVVHDQFRSPTLVEDLAWASVAAAMKEVEGIFHISGPEYMPIIEVARNVARYWNLNEELISEIDSSDLGQKAKRPPRTGFILLKAQTELGYKPHTLQQGLAVLDKQIKELAEII